MSSSKGHPFHIRHPKCANPQGEKPWAYAVLSSWHSCLAAPALQISWGYLQISRSCLWRAAVWPSVNLWFLLCSVGMGLSSRKTKPVSGISVAGLAEAMHSACLQSCLCHQSSLGDVTHSQYKLSATGLILQQPCCFTQMGDPGQRNYRWMDVWFLWCCSFFPGVPSLLPWPFSALGRAAAP